MPNGPHGDAVVHLENLLPLAPERAHQDAALIIQRNDGTARGDLGFDVLAPVGDGFDEAERFFNHTEAEDRE